MKKFRNILIYLFAGTLILWGLMAIGGFHFYTIDIPTKIPWFLLLILGAILFLSTRSKGKRIAVLIVFPLLLLLYIPVMWWFGYGLIIGIQSEIRVIESEDLKVKTISYYHQQLWGGIPYETTGIGDVYLGGLIYKTDVDTTYFAEYYYPSEVDSLIELPADIRPKDLIFVWKGQNLVLVSKRKDGNEKWHLLKYKSVSNDLYHVSD